MYTAYICVYPDGCPVGVDNSSGGYPYRVMSIGVYMWNETKYWHTYDGAKNYTDMFETSSYSSPLSVKKVIFTIEDV